VDSDFFGEKKNPRFCLFFLEFISFLGLFAKDQQTGLQRPSQFFLGAEVGIGLIGLAAIVKLESILTIPSTGEPLLKWEIGVGTKAELISFGKKRKVIKI